MLVEDMDARCGDEGGSEPSKTMRDGAVTPPRMFIIAGGEVGEELTSLL